MDLYELVEAALPKLKEMQYGWETFAKPCDPGCEHQDCLNYHVTQHIAKLERAVKEHKDEPRITDH